MKENIMKVKEKANVAPKIDEELKKDSTAKKRFSKFKDGKAFRIFGMLCTIFAPLYLYFAMEYFYFESISKFVY